MSEPDLFVVCKNCSSEVSPYVTECPYCGQRVRKRAPKIDRAGRVHEAVTRRRSRAPTLPRLRRGEIPGIAPDRRPYATGALVVAGLVVMIVLRTGAVSAFGLGSLEEAPSGDWWRLVTTAFVNPQLATAFISLVAVAVFGTLLERRFGIAVPVVLFLVCGAAGAALSVAVGAYPALGANGAALGFLCAWLVDDRLAFRRGDDRENDLLGVWVFALVLLLLPVADPNASFFAGIGGAAAGAALGALLSSLRR